MIFLVSGLGPSIPTFTTGQIMAFCFFGALGILMIGRAFMHLDRWMDRKSRDDRTPPGSSMGE